MHKALPGYGLILFLWRGVLLAQTGLEPAELSEPLPGEIIVEDQSLNAQKLVWKLAKGDILELKKFSEQDVRANDFPIKRQVYHRVLLEAKDVDKKKGFWLEGTFTSQIKNDTERAAYHEQENLTSSFYMTPRGEFSVSEKLYMPNIRSVPTMPVPSEIESGEEPESGFTWEAPGEEVMKFSELLAIPFTVHYEYRGSENIRTADGDKLLHKILSNYEINYKNTTSNRLPKKIFGYVAAVWLWDESEGIPYFSQEEYSLIITDKSGNTNEFKIKSKSYYKKIKARTSKEKDNIISSVKDAMPAEGPSLNIRKADKGVIIELPDVLFAFNSAKLSADTPEFLDRIAQALQQIGARQILVRGHTDSTGSASYNQELSEKRAQRVANYLVQENDIPAENVSYDGVGASQPIASNSTPAGRKQNRRVEIIILDK